MASGEPPPKSEATFFKEEIEAAFSRYRTMTVYEAIGALEVVKANLLLYFSLSLTLWGLLLFKFC